MENKEVVVNELSDKTEKEFPSIVKVELSSNPNNDVEMGQCHCSN